MERTRRTARTHLSSVLTALREARGVTQDGWAALLGYGRATVQRWERGERVPPADAEDAILHLCAAKGLFRQYERGPLAQMTLTPETLRAVFAETRLGQVEQGEGRRESTPPPTPVRRGRLPSLLTSFVGRNAEVEEVRRLLGGTRLLTLTGAGGVGKTRLAVQAAAALPAGLTDGVYFVELAPLTDAAMLPQAVCSALGIRETPGRSHQQALSEMLGGTSALLILDNCEHLLGACAALAHALLDACPELRVLATSRAPLGVPGEIAWRVPPMTLTGAAHLPASGPSHALPDAVRLFIDRATVASPGLVFNERGRTLIGQICRRLDGIPLAIELAAARAKVLTVEQIASRLGDRFRLLTGGSRTALPRHQTLRATLDWSHDLLAEPERVALRRLSVFAGGCTLTAAEAVCADTPADADSLLDVIVTLVDHSLLTAEVQGNEARYRMLETVREYALDRLRASGEEERVREAHAAFFLTLAEQAEPQLLAAHAVEWSARLEHEHDNLRAVLTMAGLLPEGEGLRLATALWRFWLMRGYLAEGRAWLGQMLARSDGGAVSLRARALRGSSRLALQQGDYNDAHTTAASALVLFQEIGDDLGVGQSVAALGQVAYFRGDFATAVERAEECLVIARRIGDGRLVLMALSDMANAGQFQGDLSTALVCYQEAVAIARDLGDMGNLSILLGNLALLAIRMGDLGTARPAVEEAIAVQGQLGGRTYVSGMLSWLGTIAWEEGDHAAARGHVEEALRIAREINDPDNMAGALERLADMERHTGNFATASVHSAEALRLAATLDDGKRRVTALLTAAKVAAGLGRCRRAVRLFAAAEGLREAIGFVPFPGLARETEAALTSLRAVLGEQPFADAWEQGCRLTLDEAIAAAQQPAEP